jgi:hypothetical protein
MKYDGFPTDVHGVHFFERRFIPVNHRLLQVSLIYEEKEYELDLTKPHNFYVAGNTLLTPTFVKWFMFENHNVVMNLNSKYQIKCIDDSAKLHTLEPHNCVHVSLVGFEIKDSGFV